MPAAVVLGTSTFTMSALPGTPSIQNAIPMPFFGTTPFAAPGLGVLASLIMLAFGLWWLNREETAPKNMLKASATTCCFHQIVSPTTKSFESAPRRHATLIRQRFRVVR